LVPPPPKLKKKKASEETPPEVGEALPKEDEAAPE
jgi:hypothetical protein